MRRLLLAAAGLLAGCGLGEEERFPPDEVGLEGTYVVIRCRSESPVDPPCVMRSGASGFDFLDSARVAFDRNGTAFWKRATHGTSCPCYHGGCTTPCSTYSTEEERSATYRLTTSSVLVYRLNTGIADSIVELKADIPERVTRSWTGPATLILPGNTFGLDAVFGQAP